MSADVSALDTEYATICVNLLPLLEESAFSEEHNSRLVTLLNALVAFSLHIQKSLTFIQDSYKKISIILNMPENIIINVLQSKCI